MDEKIIQDILAEVFSALEPLDAQSAAILQFLKAKGLATDDELAPFLEQARNASNVRWLAARVRIGSLLNSALKSANTKPTEVSSTEVSSKETKPAPQTSEGQTQSKSEEAEQGKQTNEENGAEETTRASAGKSQQKKPAPAQTSRNEASPNRAEQTTQQTATDEDRGEAKAEAPQKDLKETAA
jgi:hypothetical protein